MYDNDMSTLSKLSSNYSLLCGSAEVSSELSLSYYSLTCPPNEARDHAAELACLVLPHAQVRRRCPHAVIMLTGLQLDPGVVRLAIPGQF